ncbi:MAG: oligopeptide transport system permease protein AppC [Paenibacillaceae bacterium]|nr:oligopeptide transport system permease protein AppC [Paenibacillaceae bacterium]
MWSSLIKSKTGLIGAVIVILVIIMALGAPFFSPYDPAKQDLMNKLHKPVWSDGGTADHILGTDKLGRDVLSRLAYGSRITLLVAFAGTIAAGAVGVVLGAVSGYYGRWIDAVIMRIVDVQLSFPFILLALFIAAVLGAGLGNIILIAGISGWVRYARLIRGEILSVKEMEYIEAVRSMGGSDFRIIFKHILPNVISPVIVVATLEMAKIILMEASLSYLGLGVPLEIPTWGRMLSEARVDMVTSPWLAILPGLLITLTVLGINLLGDWLRDYMDPKLDV